MKMIWMGILGATLATVAMTATVAHSASVAEPVSYASDRVAFGIDGEFAGLIHTISGGGLYAPASKSMAFEPLTVEVGVSAATPMFKWIKASWDHGVAPRDLVVKAANTDYTVTTVRRLDGARISKVTVPALDASSKDPGYFTITIDPERIRYAKPKGTLTGEENKGSKKWLVSNFRLEIDGLPCERVAKIDSFTWEQKTVRDKEDRFLEPSTPPKVSDLKVTVSTADFDAWAKWHQKFIKDAGAHDDVEKTGSLTFLGPDMSTELGTIELMNVGIVSVGKTKAATAKAPAYFEVQLRVRTTKLSVAK